MGSCPIKYPTKAWILISQISLLEKFQTILQRIYLFLFNLVESMFKFLAVIFIFLTDDGVLKENECEYVTVNKRVCLNTRDKNIEKQRKYTKPSHEECITKKILMKIIHGFLPTRRKVLYINQLTTGWKGKVLK